MYSNSLEVQTSFLLPLFCFLFLTPLERKGVFAHSPVPKWAVASGSRVSRSALIRHNPCAIYEEQRMGKPPGEGNFKSRPVVVEGERRKNKGVVNNVSPPRCSLLPRNQNGAMGFSALTWSKPSSLSQTYLTI